MSIAASSFQPPINGGAVRHPDSDKLSIIRADDRTWLPDFGAMWQFRGMVGLLVWRDFKVKYKQSALGAIGVVIQPFLNVFLYTFIFGNLAQLDSDGRPYAIFTYVGMLPWMLFSTCMSSTSASLVNNSHLIQKVHFPRALLPLYGALTCLPDFLVLLGIQLAVLCCFGFVPTIHAVWIPLYVLWTLAVALSVGFGLAAIAVRYRDASVAVSFLVQLWFYATPIVYSSKLLSGKLKLIAMLNPMTWVVTGIRWGLLGTDDQPTPMLLIPLAGTLLLLACTFVFFRRTERFITDVI